MYRLCIKVDKAHLCGSTTVAHLCAIHTAMLSANMYIIHQCMCDAHMNPKIQVHLSHMCCGYVYSARVCYLHMLTQVHFQGTITCTCTWLARGESDAHAHMSHAQAHAHICPHEVIRGPVCIPDCQAYAHARGENEAHAHMPHAHAHARMPA